MLDPKDDVSAFIDEFGVEVLWKKNVEITDAQTGSTVENFKTKRINVILTKRKTDKVMTDMGNIKEEILSMYCKGEYDIKINDDILVNGVEYKVIRLADKSIFSDKSIELTFSTAGREYEISRVIPDG